MAVVAPAEWNPWQRIDGGLIAGVATPGVMYIRNADSPAKWDERVGYGWAGSFPVYLGVRLSHFELGFRLYDMADWALYKVIRPVLQRAPAGKRPLALDVVHPLLQDLGIRSIVVEKEKMLDIDELGVVTKPYEVMTFRRPKIALAKPEESAQKRSTDPIDQQIDANSGRIKALSDALANGLAAP